MIKTHNKIQVTFVKWDSIGGHAFNSERIKKETFRLIELGKTRSIQRN
jgi:hypothetical protein